MSALSIQPTYPIFTDIDGQPLEAGYVWIGQANLDPQVNPINVYWDAALTIAAPQPIRTLAGYPSRNGTPARLYVNSDYSIRVMNRNGSAVYSAPNATERYNADVISSVDVNAEDVVYDPPFLGAVQTNVEAQLSQTVSITNFGTVGDGVADDTAAVQAAIDYCLANAKALYVPAGKYRLAAQVNVPVYSNLFERDLIIHGEGMGSQFIVDHAGTGFYVTCLPSYSTYQSEFRDLYFTTGTTSPDKIIHNVGAINTLVRDCHFRSSTVGTGCVVNDNAYGLTLQGCVFWEITGTCAFYALVSNLSTYSYVNSIIDCEFSIVTKGVEMQGCNAFLVSNTVFQECDVGFYANPDVHQVTAFNITFDTCWFERNTTWDIQLDSDLSYWCEASIRNTQFSGFDPTYQGKIQLEQKSRVTIEGTPAGNTVVVHGANEAAVVLIRATNFVQSGVYAWTSIDPVGNIIAATYKSLSGTFAAPASGSAVTLTTLPNVPVGTWLVTAAVALADATTGTAVALVTTQASTSAVTSIKTASQIAISTSGLALQATQTTGIVYSITWSLIRLS